MVLMQMIPTGYYDRLWVEIIIYIQKLLVKIAVHEQGQSRLSNQLIRRLQQQQRLRCQVFLRACSPGTVTNLDAFITTAMGDVSHAGNTSIYTYSYGKLFKYL